MRELAIQVGVATLLFAGTNVDDFIALLALFADGRFRHREVVWGQLLGTTVITAASISISLGTRTIPFRYIGAMGLIPIALGVKRLAWPRSTSSKCPGFVNCAGAENIFVVTGFIIANGGDNISAYIPIFWSKPACILSLYSGVFFLLAAVWCMIAIGLLRLSRVNPLVRRYGRSIVPWFYIFLGGWILFWAGSYRMIW